MVLPLIVPRRSWFEVAFLTMYTPSPPIARRYMKGCSRGGKNVDRPIVIGGSTLQYSSTQSSKRMQCVINGQAALGEQQINA